MMSKGKKYQVLSDEDLLGVAVQGLQSTGVCMSNDGSLAVFLSDKTLLIGFIIFKAPVEEFKVVWYDEAEFRVNNRANFFGFSRNIQDEKDYVLHFDDFEIYVYSDKCPVFLKKDSIFVRKMMHNNFDLS